MGVWWLSSISGLGIRHLWNMSYCDMHIGLPRYTSGGTASLERSHKQIHKTLQNLLFNDHNLADVQGECAV